MDAWAEAKPDLLEVLSDTCPQREYFHERVELLEHLIDTGTDAGAAWLCFRVLLREHSLHVSGQADNKELDRKASRHARSLVKKVLLALPCVGRSDHLSRVPTTLTHRQSRVASSNSLQNASFRDRRHRASNTAKLILMGRSSRKPMPLLREGSVYGEAVDNFSVTDSFTVPQTSPQTPTVAHRLHGAEGFAEVASPVTVPSPEPSPGAKRPPLGAMASDRSLGGGEEAGGAQADSAEAAASAAVPSPVPLNDTVQAAPAERQQGAPTKRRRPASLERTVSLKSIVEDEPSPENKDAHLQEVRDELLLDLMGSRTESLCAILDNSGHGLDTPERKQGPRAHLSTVEELSRALNDAEGDHE